MIVKIGEKLYDSTEEPIMLILSDDDKKYISQLGNQNRYCSFPNTSNVQEIENFMKGNS